MIYLISYIILFETIHGTVHSRGSRHYRSISLSEEISQKEKLKSFLAGEGWQLFFSAKYFLGLYIRIPFKSRKRIELEKRIGK